MLSYVMLSACSPFAGDTQQETFSNISQLKLDFPPELFSHISQLAQDFISKLLVKDPRCVLLNMYSSCPINVSCVLIF